MNTFWICLAIGTAIVGYIIITDDCRLTREDIGLAIGLVLILTFCFAIPTWMIMALTTSTTTEDRLIETYSIVALEEKGNYYVGKGKTGFIDYYYFAFKEEGKGIKLDKVKADDTYLSYSMEPRIEKWANIRVSTISLEGWVPFWEDEYPEKYWYFIHVPEGSIVDRFDTVP